MKRLVAISILLALLMGACSDRTEKPEVYPELPPFLTFRFLDQSSGKNFFTARDGLSLDSVTHVDSVKIYDEWNNLIIRKPNYSSESNSSTPIPGWYFAGLDFTNLNGESVLSKDEVARNYLVHLTPLNIDSLKIVYRFTTNADGLLTAEYVKVFLNNQYLSGSQMTNSPLEAWFPR